MPIYRDDYFGRQKRLADQERNAMRDLIKIGESEPKRTQTFGRRGIDGRRAAPMPGVTHYDYPTAVEKLLEILKIRKPKKPSFRPKTPIDFNSKRPDFI